MVQLQLHAPHHEVLFVSFKHVFPHSPAELRPLDDFKVSIGNGTMSFSSYPGFIESTDDFFILGSNMVMLETTNNVFNQSLYKYVTPTTAYVRAHFLNCVHSR